MHPDTDQDDDGRTFRRSLQEPGRKRPPVKPPGPDKPPVEPPGPDKPPVEPPDPGDPPVKPPDPQHPPPLRSHCRRTGGRQEHGNPPACP
jgi:hypothetical protein